MGASCPLKPGDLVDGRYRVEGVLGEGGIGCVVAAHHVELETRVAIKVLRDEYAMEGERAARFYREGRAAARLTGDHSVRVLDVGRLPSGSPFLVMERLEGRDLAQRLVADGPCGISEAMDYILQAAEGIAEAHALGVVHRDVKLANLFLSKRTDGTPLVKVLDFGLVKLTGPTKNHTLTQSQVLMGSPVYMSPEQLRMSRDVNHATDIWSLGVCLYELLTGKPPFDAPSFAELVVLVLQHPAPKLHATRPDAPRALSAVVDRCLAKEPRERFRDVGELVRALEPLTRAPSEAPSEEAPKAVAAMTGKQQDGEATWVRSRSDPTRRWIRAGIGAGLVGVTALVGWAAMTSTQAKPTDEASATHPSSTSAAEPVPTAPTARAAVAPSATAPLAAPVADSPRPSASAPSPILPHPATTKAPSGDPRARIPKPLTSAPAVDCKSPYVIDSEGYRKYKPECL